MTVDMVHEPRHYQADRFGCECITLTRRMPFSSGNAVKYVWRHQEKNGTEDLRKALVYLNWALEDDEWPMDGNTDLWQLYREHVKPHLEGQAHVYRAIGLIIAGHHEEARDIITDHLEELS